MVELMDAKVGDGRNATLPRLGPTQANSICRFWMTLGGPKSFWEDLGFAPARLSPPQNVPTIDPCGES